MLERELDHANDIACEAVNATAMHLRRIAGLVATALARAAHEVADLAWDYRDLAGDLSSGARQGCSHESGHGR
jgi:hypothetical protein